MGLNVAGVDLPRSNHGPGALDVNSSPGLQRIESATGKEVTVLIVKFIEENAKSNRTPTRGKS
jgi:ribosomal protein S6--L-glutamate ligase